MAFFKPKAVFFIIKHLFNGEKYNGLINWLNSLGQIINFNTENGSVFVGDELITFGKNLDFLKEDR